MKNPCWAIAIDQIHFALVAEVAYQTYTVTLEGAKALLLTETLKIEIFINMHAITITGIETLNNKILILIPLVHQSFCAQKCGN